MKVGTKGRSPLELEQHLFNEVLPVFTGGNSSGVCHMLKVDKEKAAIKAGVTLAKLTGINHEDLDSYVLKHNIVVTNKGAVFRVFKNALGDVQYKKLSTAKGRTGITLTFTNLHNGNQIRRCVSTKALLVSAFKVKDLDGDPILEHNKVTDLKYIAKGDKVTLDYDYTDINTNLWLVVGSGLPFFNWLRDYTSGSVTPINFLEYIEPDLKVEYKELADRLKSLISNSRVGGHSTDVAAINKLGVPTYKLCTMLEKFKKYANFKYQSGIKVKSRNNTLLNRVYAYALISLGLDQGTVAAMVDQPISWVRRNIEVLESKNMYKYAMRSTSIPTANLVTKFGTLLIGAKSEKDRLSIEAITVMVKAFRQEHLTIEEVEAIKEL